MTAENPEWQLIDRLLTLTRDWNAFDLVDEQVKQECRLIGEELDKLGGYDLMLYAYRTARAANKCSTAVQAYWDGVGAWRW
jgi:hypothetical protein